jgi:glycerol uptake facilitator-like aquaporin
MKKRIWLVTLNIAGAILASLVVSVLSNQYIKSQMAAAQSSSKGSFSTKWEKVEMSMTELLNSGWQISGHSSTHAAFRAVNDNMFSEKGYTFLLNKNSKYVMCFVENPFAPVTNSACRKLN